jgi:hypothetical protein
VYTYSKFGHSQYWATFRKDGNLLAATGEEGRIRLFRTGSVSRMNVPLRNFVAHNRYLRSIF